MVAPALIAVSTQRHRKSCSVRVRVLGRPLDVVDVVARALDRGADQLEHLGGLLLQLALHVDRRGGDEGVDARPLGMSHRLAAAVDVLEAGAGEAGDGRSLDPLWRSRLTASKSPSEAIGKPGLDDVDAHLVEQLGDLELLLERHRRAGRLLAVAQRGVEDDDVIGDGRGLLGSWSWRAS